MDVPSWIAWPCIVVGWLVGYGLGLIWWKGIDLWLRWRKMKPDFLEAYMDVKRKRQREQVDRRNRERSEDGWGNASKKSAQKGRRNHDR